MKKILFSLLSLLILTFGITISNAEVSKPSKYPDIENHFNDPFSIGGETSKSWNFPSDHLPTGLKVDNFHIAFWNILNKKNIHNVEKDSQRLKNSLTNIKLEKINSLTFRENQIYEQIKEMMQHPKHPRSLIALQETHEDFLNYLTFNLPDNWVIITPPDQPISQDIFLFDSNVFDFVDVEAIKYNEKDYLRYS